MFNFRVCAQGQPDLYSRGLFPNGHGIHFVGRVHEIPVLPAQTLPNYHCQDLILWHQGSQSQTKQAYYQRLMQQNLSETTDPTLRNHLYKHLGLSHLQAQNWHAAWQELQVCYAGFAPLGIQASDGFYTEVLRGLVEAGNRLRHPDTVIYAAELSQLPPLDPMLKEVFQKQPSQARLATLAALSCVLTGLLTACQLSTPHRQTLPLAHIGSAPQVETDFKLQFGNGIGSYRSVHHCLVTDARQACGVVGYGYGPVNACYQAGGFPIWTQHIHCAPITHYNGSRCSGLIYNAVFHACDHGDYTEPAELSCQADFEVKVSPPNEEPYCMPCPAPLQFMPYHEVDHLPEEEQTRVACYSENGVLAYEPILPAPEPDYPMPENARVFSPRNQDGVLDHLPIRAGLNEQSSELNRFWSLSLVQFYPEADRLDALANGELPYSSLYSFPSQDEAGNDLNIGVKNLSVTGFETETCLADGRYGIVIDTGNYVPEFPTNTGPKGFPFNLHVPLLEDNLLPFWVDNTPPIVQSVQIHETQTQTEPEAYSTNVSFTLKEPIVNEAYSNLEPASIKVFVDSSPLYSIPDIDEPGFWLLSQWPQNQLNIQTLDTRTAQVSFSLPHRLPGHLIEVEVADKAANQARYTIYPKGDNF